MFSIAARRSVAYSVGRLFSTQRRTLLQIERNPKLHPRTHLPLLRSYATNGPKESFSSRLRTEIDSGGLRRNRWAIITFTALVTSALGGLAYYMYLYNELVEKPLSVYPPQVAKQIKQALYYASQNDAAKMANSFKKAITLAEESGIHPLSDKIAGLKIECAALLAKINDGEHKGKAVEILEKVLDEAVAGADYFTEEKRWKDRSQVLQRAVMLGYKVGEMYSQMQKNQQAEEAMVWSTETLLREIHRRERDKATDAEQGEWFDRLAVAGCLEKLADHYERTNQHVLATPLYLRAATLSPQDNCHTVTVMGNLAACLSQQNPPPGSTITRAKLIEDGQKWALKALEIDANIKPPNRTPECDEACIVATHNLGEMAEMLGDMKGALARYQEALSLAKGLKMEAAMEQAEKGIKRVQGKR